MITPPVTRPVNNGLQRAAYTPEKQIVTNVTNEINATVTTQETHGFSVGQTIRLRVPKEYGMEVNQRGRVISVNDTVFVVGVDTSTLLAFSAPTAVPNTPSAFTDAQAVADSGEWNNIGKP